jgi:uncharacterized damage-inducible protein DinB
MKEILMAIAKYNRGANTTLLDTIEKAGPAIASKPVGIFYKTVLATIQHYLWYEVSWLARYRALGDYASLRDPLLDEEAEALKASVGADFAKTAALLRKTDSIFVAFAEEARSEDLPKPIRFKNFRGEDQERLAWQTIFHVLNHSTHHRGEISGALDGLGVANDFAGFYRYL